MKYKELKLRAKTPDGASTEIMYEIATARADGFNLIRIDISYDENEGSVEIKKIIHTLIKLLKSMKQNGNIHFFATPESFSLGSTEAVFLQNKYPEHFADKVQNNEGMFIYIKL